MSLAPPLQAIVDFVRKGSPQDVPQQGYMLLFALLGRRLSDEAEFLIPDGVCDLFAEGIGARGAQLREAGDLGQQL